MAEGFELYHVPQQSRRDKLRCVEDLQQLQGCVGLLPLYDPSSLISSHLLACANPNQNPTQGVKEEDMSLMGFAAAGGIINNACSSNSSSSYMDPQSFFHNIQDLNNQNHTFLYNPQNLRLIDHQTFTGGGGDELVVYKPEPLSLSLSSHNTHNTNHPLELNLQRYESSIYSTGGGGGDFCGSMVPLGPFTGYASILKGSMFLKPAQQLLEEICDVGCGVYAEKFSVDSALMDSPLECLSRSGFNVDDPNSGGGDKRKKSRLISMLDEVYKRYKQYYQQIQAVIASFETVAGLSNAAPFASLDIKAMSKHFRYLKNAITDQLQFTTKQHMNCRKEETVARSGSSDRGLYGQMPPNNLGFVDHQPVWRPQRGLPERAVTVLRTWLFDHFLHPYPTDTDKLMLAKQTGLSRNQVSNWFINARVRLWKPMVEEIHTLETRQVQNASHEREEVQDDANRTDDHNLPSPTTLNPPISPQRIMQDPPHKRTRNDLSSNLTIGSDQEQMNFLYDNVSRHRQLGTSGGNTVSLTLGLHQNNGPPVGLSEPFPINAAHRFGLDVSSETSYVMGGFDAQNRQFGREIIGGQLLHDFVG